MVTSIHNGSPMMDVNGNPLHAHGAGFLEENGYYYMFGEIREGDKRVACYRSKDLMNWEFRNVVLHIGSPKKPYYIRTKLELEKDGRGVNIERPKVIYCEKTRQYVMWMHVENGFDYSEASCAVATCDTVDGDYTYRGAFRPVGNMSRDCTIFKDNDGTAYFISSARGNADMCVYRLTDDYMGIDEQVKTLWPGQYREAPAVFERDGKYYFLSSMCTGWNPNQGGVSYSNGVTGRWSAIEPFGDCVTYNTQPTYVLKLGENYIYVGDRWDPKDYSNSGYVFLPIQFNKKGCFIQWADEISFDVTAKTYSLESREHDDIRILTDNYESYLSSDGSLVFMSKLSYKDEKQIWRLQEVAEGVKLIHKATGKALSSDGLMHEPTNTPEMLWRVKHENGISRLISCKSNKVLNVRDFCKEQTPERHHYTGLLRFVQAY